MQPLEKVWPPFRPLFFDIGSHFLPAQHRHPAIRVRVHFYRDVAPRHQGTQGFEQPENVQDRPKTVSKPLLEVRFGKSVGQAVNQQERFSRLRRLERTQ